MTRTRLRRSLPRAVAVASASLALTIGIVTPRANAEATACEGEGADPPILLAAGVVAAGETDAYGFDGVLGRSIDVWPQKAPDMHGAFVWTLRDRATGAVFADGDANELHLPRFLGASPYDDLCLEVTTFQSFVTQYSIAVVAR